MIKLVVFSMTFLIGCILQYLMSKYINKTEYKFNNKWSWLACLISGILMSIIWYISGFTFDFLIHSCLLIILITIAFIDIQHKLIPDRLNIAILLLGSINIIHLLILKESILNHFLGFLVAGIGFLLLALISNGGMGGGDVKLIACIGLVIGLEAILSVIYLSFLAGSIIGIIFIILKKKNMKSYLPFAPFIAIATIMYLTINPLNLLNLI